MIRLRSFLPALLFTTAAVAAQPDPATIGPAVDTSAPAQQSRPASPAATPTPATPTPATQTPAAQTPATPASAPPPPAASRPNAPTSGNRARDRLELETTQITGNRELPRVMYVVPWKKSDLGDPGGKPANSLLDEVLAPVDRDVFQRQNRYYDALKPDAADTAGAAPGN